MLQTRPIRAPVILSLPQWQVCPNQGCNKKACPADLFGCWHPEVVIVLLPDGERCRQAQAPVAKYVRYQKAYDHETSMRRGDNVRASDFINPTELDS